MILNKGTRAGDGEVDIRAGGYLTARLALAGKKRVNGAVRGDPVDAVSGRPGHDDVSRIEAGLQKVRAARVSNRVTQFKVPLVVPVVTHVGGPELRDAGYRDSRSVVICAGQLSATRRELTA